MWYCYLDQDNLDSSFYRLEDPFRRLKSRDAMRFITGLYTERMNELEINLDEVRAQRRSKVETIKQIRTFLDEYGFGSEIEIQERIETTRIELTDTKQKQKALQQEHMTNTHFADDLRERLRQMSETLATEKGALADLDERIAEQEKLKAELLSAKFKLAKADTAINVLSGVIFERCPVCGKEIVSDETHGVCYLCKTPDSVEEQEDITSQAVVVSRDLTSRVDDLTESINRHKNARKSQKRRIADLENRKKELDLQLSEELSNYDSAYLTQAKEVNRQAAILEERIRGLTQLTKLPKAINDLLSEVEELKKQETSILDEIEHEKSKLFDAYNHVQDIEQAYINALLRVGVPGISADDKIELNPQTWLPSILPPDGDAYNFYNAGSGGKKTLLNACYALAVHEVAVENNSPLPRFLMIDTPMKNIGEDVNKEIFEAFYEYLYELASNKLANTQFIIIDKEFLAPATEVNIEMMSKFMDPDENPLISYYRGA